MTTPTFHWMRVRGTAPGWPPIARDLRETTFPEVQAAGGTVWGLFQPLFGIRNDEVVLVTVGAAVTREMLPAGARISEEFELAPTVRPTTTDPCSRPGLYVHRFMEVEAPNIDEVAALSNEAWTSFEATDAYESQPQALFCEAARPPNGKMLLVTWYDGFTSWEKSRSPAPAATENFRRRAQISHGSVGYATRLILA